MQATGQIRLLESQGVDPYVLLAVPRVIAATVCVPLLTVAFIVLTLGVGQSSAMLFGVAEKSPIGFMNEVLGLISQRMYISAALKTTLSGYPDRALRASPACVQAFHSTTHHACCPLALCDVRSRYLL